MTRAGIDGQAWAQREIWFRYAPMVRTFLRRSMGSRYDAEDLLQEVFLRVFSRLRAIEKPEALRSFIHSVAIRVAGEEIRRHRIRSRLASLFLRLEREPSVPHVDFESRDLLRRIEHVMDRMEPRQRTVLVLRHIDGIELAEIAASLELSMATVKRDIEKAQHFIARHLRRDPSLHAQLTKDTPDLAVEAKS